MVIQCIATTLHLLLAATTPDQSSDLLSRPVLNNVAAPLLTSAQFLIPAAVAISGIHKMMEHRESGGSFLVDMVTKGGGAVIVLQLVKAISGIG
jgi:hypothetical protein